jgi:hypothetical protein
VRAKNTSAPHSATAAAAHDYLLKMPPASGLPKAEGLLSELHRSPATAARYASWAFALLLKILNRCRLACAYAATTSVLAQGAAQYMKERTPMARKGHQLHKDPLRPTLSVEAVEDCLEQHGKKLAQPAPAPADERRAGGAAAPKGTPAARSPARSPATKGPSIEGAIASW